MAPSIYHKKCEWLFNQYPAFQKKGESAYHPSFDGINKLIAFFDIPISRMKFIHIAGTNGKGTTCAVIASVLTECKKKTGLFTSPHIKDFRERIRINGKKISQREIINYIDTIRDAKLDFNPSFFEITWAIALDYFYVQQCDIIVVETGIGGRLDATNIIKPSICGITNVGIDHVNILGNTRKEIATEKAGIIKKNVPVVIGESDEETQPVFEEKSRMLNAPIFFLEDKGNESVFEKNKRLAFKIIDVLMGENNLSSEKNKGLSNLFQNTGWYGRNQLLNTSPPMLVDAAHNLKGVENFINETNTNYASKQIHAVYGASADKDIESIIKIFPAHWNYYFTAFSNKRSASLETYKKIASNKSLKAHYFSSPKKAINFVQQYDSKKDMIVVFGSFYLLEEIF